MCTVLDFKQFVEGTGHTHPKVSSLCVTSDLSKAVIVCSVSTDTSFYAMLPSFVLEFSYKGFRPFTGNVLVLKHKKSKEQNVDFSQTRWRPKFIGHQMIYKMETSGFARCNSFMPVMMPPRFLLFFWTVATVTTPCTPVNS